MNIRGLGNRLRWKAKQKLAGPSRYYGDGGTIHHSGYLDVETFEGKVVAVWFRCQPLAFKQVRVDTLRGTEMDDMYEDYGSNYLLTGVEVVD